MLQKNYLTGYNDGTYRPDQAATREDVTVSMVKLKGYDLSEVDYFELNKFSDNDSISNNMKAYIAVAVEKGLIDGFEDNTFRGQATLTRAEAATLLYRAFQKGNDDKVVNTSSTEKPTIIPTVKPVEKPTPNPIKNPTPNPTKAPTLEPTEEPTPEPTETPKPYKIDTVVKADVGGYLQYTQDNDDNIYYKENNAIYKTNIYERNKDKIIDGKDIVIDNDEMTLSGFKIRSVCYDGYRDKILVTGNFENVNTAKMVENNYLCSVSEEGFTVITDSFPKDGLLIKVINNGNYIANYYGYIKGRGMVKDSIAIIDSETFKDIDRIIDCGGSVYDVFDADTELYLTSGSVYVYDYVKMSYVLWNLNSCVAIGQNKIIAGDKSGICIYNFKGKKLQSIVYDDITVTDRAKIDFSSNIMRKMFITNDDSIVFYDISSNAFRILKSAEK